MDFGRTGGMSTATLSQRRERRNREKVRGKKKERQRERRNQMSTATVAAKGTEGACYKQDGREHEEGREKGT